MVGDVADFWLGTLGPFPQVGCSKRYSRCVYAGRLCCAFPYAWMFQYIPGMSRMFAPYRMASMVVVCAVILVAINMDRLNETWKRRGGLVLLFAIVLQPFYRFDLEELAEWDANHLCGVYHFRYLR